MTESKRTTERKEPRHFRAVRNAGRWDLQTKNEAGWSTSVNVPERSDVVRMLSRLAEQGCVIEDSPDLKWKGDKGVAARV